MIGKRISAFGFAIVICCNCIFGIKCNALDLLEESIRLIDIDTRKAPQVRVSIGCDRALEILEVTSSAPEIDTATQLGRIAKLYKQFTELTDDRIETFNGRYFLKIDQITDRDSAMAVLKETQVNWNGVYSFTPGLDIEIIGQVPDDTEEATISDQTAREALVEFIDSTSEMQLGEIGEITEYNITQFKKLLSCLETPEGLEITKNSIKRQLGEFVSDLKGRVALLRNWKASGMPTSEEFENSDSIAWWTGRTLAAFGGYLGSEFYRLMYHEILEREFPGRAETIIGECIEEVRQAFKREILHNEVITQDSKTKISVAFDNIIINSNSVDSFFAACSSSLVSFEIGEDFLESLWRLTNTRKRMLRSVPTEKGSLNQCAKFSAVIGDTTPNVIFTDRNSRLGICHSDFREGAIQETIFDTLFICIPLPDILRLSELSKHTQLLSLGLNREETFKILFCDILSHECGHCVDACFGTIGGSNNMDLGIADRDKAHVIKVKSALKNYLEQKTGQEPRYDIEIFADYLRCSAMYNIARNRGYSDEQTRSFVKIMALGFSQMASSDDPEKMDEMSHPPISIRSNGIFGHFDWTYSLFGSSISTSDFLYVSPDDRIRF